MEANLTIVVVNDRENVVVVINKEFTTPSSDWGYFNFFENEFLKDIEKICAGGNNCAEYFAVELINYLQQKYSTDMNKWHCMEHNLNDIVQYSDYIVVLSHVNGKIIYELLKYGYNKTAYEQLVKYFKN